ncbi:MAG: hypothetical protein EA361_09750 [Bacteroidetes bacterium]|nr:MAG: hypothetical protein EA361_09750 [Bacteroidota bacterium]
MQRVSSVVLLLVGLVLIIMVSVYLVLMEFQKRAALSAVSPYSYIPADAGMVYQLSKPFDFITSKGHNTPFPKEVSDILSLNRFHDLLGKAASIPDFQSNSGLHSDASMFISWHNMEEPGKSNRLFLLALPHRSRAEKSVFHIIENLFPDSRIQKSDTANHTIYSIVSPEMSGELHFFQEKNFMVLSSDKKLLITSKDAARNNTGLINNQTAFSELVINSRKDENRLLIEPSVFCNFITDYFFWDHPLSIDCSLISGWISLNVSRKSETPGFDGFLLTHRQLPGIFSTFKFQEPAGTGMQEFIPAMPSLIYHQYLPDTELFEQDYKFVLQQNKRYSLFELHKRRFQDVAAISTDSLSGYWTGELAMVLPGKQQWQNEYPVVLMGANHFEGLLQHPRLGIFFLTQAPEGETQFLPGPLVEISIPGFFQVFTHGLIKDDLRWAVISEEYVMASARKENLLKYFEQLHIEKDTILRQNDLMLQDALNDEHNIMLYYSVPRLLETFEVMFTDRFLDLQELSKASFPDFGQMMLQFTAGPGDRVNSVIRFSFVDSLSVDSLSEIRDVKPAQKQ